MYCVKCGVKLEDGINECPLCHTPVIYNQEQLLEKKKYSDIYPTKNQASLTFASISTAIFLLACILVLLINFKVYNHLSWGSYALFSIGLAYMIFIFPYWFPFNNKKLFTIIDLISITLFLLFINIISKGNWFLSFAFPLMGIISLIIISLFFLSKHIKKYGFYIVGGTIIFVACSCMLIELFESITFDTKMFSWSLYVVSVGGLVGLFFILAGIIKPLGNHIKKIFYI